jgi:hypothetical protein
MEHWSVARSKDKKKTAVRPIATTGQTASIFAFLTVGGLLIAALLLPGPGPGAALGTRWERWFGARLPSPCITSFGRAFRIGSR